VQTDPSVIERKLEDYLKAKQNADEYLKASGLGTITIVRPAFPNGLKKGTVKIQLNGKKLENSRKVFTRADVAKKTLIGVFEDDHNAKSGFRDI